MSKPNPNPNAWRTWMPILQVRIDKRLKRDLFRYAEEHDSKVSDLVRVAVKEFLRFGESR